MHMQDVRWGRMHMQSAGFYAYAGCQIGPYSYVRGRGEFIWKKLGSMHMQDVGVCILFIICAFPDRLGSQLERVRGRRPGAI